MIADTKLCDLNYINDGEAKGFTLNTKHGRCGLIVIRRGNKVIGYINSCPHIGTPLEISPERFLDRTREYILCSTHGALFQISDGLCVSGPCFNERLTPFHVEVRDGVIFVDKKGLPTLWPPISGFPSN